MKKWKTNLYLNHAQGSTVCKNINIKCGIFQSDSLSPLLSCMALVPLSYELNNTGYGYNIYEEKINHLFYMNDLKLYGKNDYELEGLLRTVKTFSDDIGMTFDLDKCAKATFIRGKLKSTSSIVLDIDTKIKKLDQEDTYKYIGIEEGDGIQHGKMKEEIRKECYRRVRAVLQSELNARNKLEAINTLATPVVSYSFNVVNWNLDEIKKIDRKIRKLMTLSRMHHSKADVSRMYIPRKEGGRGMVNLEMTYKTATIGLNSYLESPEDRMLHAA